MGLTRFYKTTVFLHLFSVITAYMSVATLLLQPGTERVQALADADISRSAPYAFAVYKEVTHVYVS